jgi:hypothetical protein
MSRILAFLRGPLALPWLLLVGCVLWGIWEWFRDWFWPAFAFAMFITLLAVFFG